MERLLQFNNVVNRQTILDFVKRQLSSKHDPILEGRRQQRPQILGTTFSLEQCDYLNNALKSNGKPEIPHKDYLQTIINLGVQEVRLVAYWNRIEPVAGQYQFQELDWQMDLLDEVGLPYGLNFGIKVVRWPEVWLPKWLEQKYQQALATRGKPIDAVKEVAEQSIIFGQRLVEHTRDRNNLLFYQPENEPLRGLTIADGRYLSFEHLKEKVGMLHQSKRPDQKILVSTDTDWEPKDGEDFANLQKILGLSVDRVGLNVYLRIENEQSLIGGPTRAFIEKLIRWSGVIAQSGKEAIVTELQYEPWKAGSAVHIDQEIHRSATPELGKELVLVLGGMGFRIIYLWGAEHGVAHHQKYGKRYWLEPTKRLIASR